MADSVRKELGEFLRARRAEMTPEDVGLKPYGRRRVAGLRREELAMLAGVSVGYYTRIEQGQPKDPSPEVLLAIANALRLVPSEREYLLALAAPQASKVREYEPEVVSDALAGLLMSLGDVAGVVLGRRLDLLAWTPLAHDLLAPHLLRESVADASSRPNWARLIFTDRQMRELFVDWEAKCWDVATYLRVRSGSHPQDSRLGSLISELCLSSNVFDEMWTSRRVKDGSTPDCVIKHPRLGRLELLHVPLSVVDASEQMLASFFARPGSHSAAAVARLAAEHRGSDAGDARRATRRSSAHEVHRKHARPFDERVTKLGQEPSPGILQVRGEG
jgi:transcriptional regulator with XRE-family HTH domain